MDLDPIAEKVDPLGDWREVDALLGELRSGESLYFWFRAAVSEHPAVLLVDRDSSQLKTRSKTYKGDGAVTRGTLELESKGWIHFKTHKDSPSFLSELSKSVALVWVHGAGIRRLVGARLTCRDKSGELLGRYRSKDMWPKDEGK